MACAGQGAVAPEDPAPAGSAAAQDPPATGGAGPAAQPPNATDNGSPAAGVTGGAPASTAGASAAGQETGMAGNSGQPSSTPTPGPVELEPIARADDSYVLQFGQHLFEVDPTRGGRVVTYSFDGHNLLQPVARASDFLNGGSTLWTSPQSDWSWPPLRAHDELPYRASVNGQAIELAGDAAALAGTQVALEKRFAADLDGQAIVIDYTVRNAGESSVALAAWEVTRVATGGLTFWPAAGAPRGPFGATRHGEHYFLSYDQAWAGSAGKLLADAGAGWLAHVDGDVLFLKSWQDVPADRQVEGEAEIEIYLAPGYVELETQGPSQLLAAGASSSFTVRWQLRQLPPEVDITPGSASLIQAALEVLR